MPYDAPESEVGMATVEECRRALDTLAERIQAHAERLRGKSTLDRRLTLRIRDLDVSFQGRLHDGTLSDIEDGADPNAKVRIEVGSDDLVDLVGGRLNFAAAWASGKLSVRASVLDLVKLRSLL